MKREKSIRRTLAIAALLSAASTAGTAASGEISPELQGLRTKSEKEALGERALVVLRRQPGPGNDAALDTALRALDASGFPGALGVGVPTPHGGSLYVKTEGWALQVASEGCRVRFWSNKHGVRLADEGLPYEEAKKIALSALENELAPLLPLGSNEKLVPLDRSDGRVGGSDRRDGVMTDQVVENVVRFSRSVDGVAVVGPGSRAIVTLDNDGSLIAFDIDWSGYLPTDAVQQTLPIAQIDGRLATLEAKEVLSPNRQKKYVACGYYDSGTVNDPAAELIQPACVYRFDLMPGTLDVAVPAGEDFTTDSGWTETQVLADSDS